MRRGNRRLVSGNAERGELLANHPSVPDREKHTNSARIAVRDQVDLRAHRGQNLHCGHQVPGQWQRHKCGHIQVHRLRQKSPQEHHDREQDARRVKTQLTSAAQSTGQFVHGPHEPRGYSLVHARAQGLLHQEQLGQGPSHVHVARHESRALQVRVT